MSACINQASCITFPLITLYYLVSVFVFQCIYIWTVFLFLLQKTVLSLIGFVAPQLGIRSIDPNDISSIPEEVGGIYVVYAYLYQYIIVQWILYLPVIIVLVCELHCIYNICTTLFMIITMVTS